MVRLVLSGLLLVLCSVHLALAQGEMTLECDGEEGIASDLAAKKSPFAGAGPWHVQIEGVSADQVYADNLIMLPIGGFKVDRNGPLDFSVAVADPSKLVDEDGDLKKVECVPTAQFKGLDVVEEEGTGAAHCQIYAEFTNTALGQLRPLETLGKQKRIEVPAYECPSSGACDYSKRSTTAKFLRYKGTAAYFRRPKGDTSKVVVRLNMKKGNTWGWQGTADLPTCGAPGAVGDDETPCTSRAFKRCDGKAVRYFDSCHRPEEVIQSCGKNESCENAACVSSCAKQDHKACAIWPSGELSKDVYWWDSCGNRGSVAIECTGDTSCHQGRCVENCTPQDHYACVTDDENVWWIDSCGVPHDIKETCRWDQTCLRGRCSCIPDEELRCFAGNVYNYDSCGKRGRREERCVYGEECVEDGDGWAYCEEEDDDDSSDYDDEIDLYCCSPVGMRMCPMLEYRALGSWCQCRRPLPFGGFQWVNGAVCS